MNSLIKCNGLHGHLHVTLNVVLISSEFIHIVKQKLILYVHVFGNHVIMS